MARGLEVTIRRQAMVTPSEATPERILWNSNVDLVIPRIHTQSVYFYRNEDGRQDFLSHEKLAVALAKTLVPFYPMAGRLRRGEGGRVEINCNAQGVLLVEAQADAVVADFGEFAPDPRFKQLVPQVDYSQDIASFPLLVLQVTFFRCGGASLGVGMQHHVADGMSGIHCINTWSEMARGIPLRVQPFIDRTLLKANSPPAPKYPHIEYQPPPRITKREMQGNDALRVANGKNSRSHHGENGNGIHIGNGKSNGSSHGVNGKSNGKSHGENGKGNGKSYGENGKRHGVDNGTRHRNGNSNGYGNGSNGFRHDNQNGNGNKVHQGNGNGNGYGNGIVAHHGNGKSIGFHKDGENLTNGHSNGKSVHEEVAAMESNGNGFHEGGEKLTNGHSNGKSCVQEEDAAMESNGNGFHKDGEKLTNGHSNGKSSVQEEDAAMESNGNGFHKDGEKLTNGHSNGKSSVQEEDAAMESNGNGFHKDGEKLTNGHSNGKSSVQEEDAAMESNGNGFHKDGEKLTNGHSNGKSSVQEEDAVMESNGNGFHKDGEKLTNGHSNGKSSVQEEDAALERNGNGFHKDGEKLTNGHSNGRSEDAAMAVRVFRFTKEQLATLKQMAVEGKTDDVVFSSYEMLSGHIWKCVTQARELHDAQETKLFVATDGRNRLDPPLPPGYFGNVIFTCTPIATAGELVRNPVTYAARKIHDALARMNAEYLRSALDYLEVQKDVTKLVRGAHHFNSPNLGITSWARMPVYECDFGWGRPVFMGPSAIAYEGLAYVLSSAVDDGSLSLSLGLRPDHMTTFATLVAAI